MKSVYDVLKSTRTQETETRRLHRGAMLASVGFFIGSTLLLAGCSDSPPEDEVAEALEGLSVPFDSISRQHFLYPDDLKVTRGAADAQPISVLAAKEQSGRADSASTYKKLSPDSGNFSGVFSFRVPDSIDSSMVSNLALLANYRCLSQADQRWQFQLYDAMRSRWVVLGDSLSIKQGVWSPLAFVPRGSMQPFISSSRKLSLRLVTRSNAQSCDLDYLAIGFDGRDVTPPPSPPPAPPPSPPPAGARWMPTPGTSWQMQFSGTLDTSLSVQAYDIDLFDSSKATIDKLHARGIKVMCYVAAGTWEKGRPDAASFPSSVLGSTVAGWPDERWLDVRQIATLRPIMGARMDLGVQKGCDAIDSDSADVYDVPSGFSISMADQLAYNKMMAEEAHKRGLSIGLKNDYMQVKELVDIYDFAVNEECIAAGDCDWLKPFIDHNKAVFGVEYAGTAASVCPTANRLNFDTLLKHESIDAYRIACR